MCHEVKNVESRCSKGVGHLRCVSECPVVLTREDGRGGRPPADVAVSQTLAMSGSATNARGATCLALFPVKFWEHRASQASYNYEVALSSATDPPSFSAQFPPWVLSYVSR